MSYGNWQVIDTAPRDGTSIIIIDEASDIPTICFWDEGFERDWVVSWDGACFHPMGQTFWMPLPSAPTLKQAEDGK